MAARGARGPYASRVARRESIMNAAVDVLAEVGYHGMSLRDVARKVGISHPGVIYHFPSKEVLLMSVVSDYEEKLGFDLDQLEVLDAQTVLDSILMLLSRMGESPLLVEVECMLRVEASSNVHPAHDHFESRNQRLHSVLEKAWTELVVQGRVQGDETPANITSLQTAVYYGLMNQWLYDHDFDAVGGMVKYYKSVFVPDYAALMRAHYRESGWLR